MRPLAATAAALLLAAAPASALDLTGTWTGTFKCSEFQGTQDKFKENETLRITQVGSDLHVQWVDVADLRGVAIADVRKPDAKGGAAITDCDTDADLGVGYDEMAILKAKVNRAKGKGSLKGESIYSPGSLVTGSCKWSYKLVDPADPGVVVTCP